MRLAFAITAILVLAGCASRPAPSPALVSRDLPAFFDCLRENRLAIVGAHRGGYGRSWPENALETMAHTARTIPALLEIDIRRSSDGVLVLIHDETLERTTTGVGRVADLPAAELTALTLKDESGAPTTSKLPTLSAALSWAKGRAVLQLDVKRGVPFAEVISAVRAAGMESQAVVIVYTLGDAAEVHRLAPSMMISANIRDAAELDAILASGIDRSRLIAFTGTRAPDATLNARLAAAGIEAIFGTLGRKGESLDDRFAAEGEGGYLEVAKTGVTVIATNRAAAAWSVLDRADGRGFAPGRCLR
jgi:glycerophosphoryl diester phosphodiesterase